MVVLAQSRFGQAARKRHIWVARFIASATSGIIWAAIGVGQKPRYQFS